MKTSKKDILNAFHSNWTKPFFARNGSPYFVEDFELLTTILSALEWRKHNGSICMITDSTGAEYYRRLGLEHIWDKGIDTALETAVSGKIYPLSLWAAGKIYALSSHPAPCVMIDTDFIVWKPITNQLKNETLVVAHREDIASWYPEKSFFNMDPSYRFPDEWDWSVLPCNTALLYIADERFKEYYTTESIRFMLNLRETKDITAEMVFAEQRLLAMCTTARGIAIKSFMDKDNQEAQTSFTHVWGLKENLRTDPEQRRDFCVNCVKRIQNDFPEELPALEKIASILPYIESMNTKGKTK